MVIKCDNYGQYTVTLRIGTECIGLLVDTGAAMSSVTITALARGLQCDADILGASILKDCNKISLRDANMVDVMYSVLAIGNVYINDIYFESLDICTQPVGMCANLLGMNVLKNCSFTQSMYSGTLDLNFGHTPSTARKLQSINTLSKREALLLLAQYRVGNVSIDLLKQLLPKVDMSDTMYKTELNKVVDKLQHISLNTLREFAQNNHLHITEDTDLMQCVLPAYVMDLKRRNLL